MKLETLIEILSAVHLSVYVEGPFKERGGLMLVAPPESLKTSTLDILNFYNSAEIFSDLNNQQLAKMREQISAGKITTLAFSEFGKLYQRNPAVASNLEGNLAAMVAEGFRAFGHEDVRMQMVPAHAAVVACMTNTFHQRNFTRWLEEGFSRRFLWSVYRLENPEIITSAIEEWKRIEFSAFKLSPKVPSSRTIRYTVEPDENMILLRMLKFQPGQTIGFTLLKKILCVLRWKYSKEPNRPMEIIRDFAPSLGKTGCVLTAPSNGFKR